MMDAVQCMRWETSNFIIALSTSNKKTYNIYKTSVLKLSKFINFY